MSSSPSDERDQRDQARRIAELEAEIAGLRHSSNEERRYVAGRAAPFEHELWLRAILESATDYAIIALDLSGRIVGWNAGATRVLGWSERDVLARHASLCWTPEDQANGLLEEEMRVAVEQGTAVGERWYVRADGTQFWAAGQLLPLCDRAHRGYLQIFRDETLRHQTSEALRRSEERLRMIVESARDYAIFTLDHKGCITSWNSGATAILGWNEADVVGQSAALLYRSDDVVAGEPMREIATALAQGRVEGERWMLRQDGTQFWAEQTLSPLNEAGGERRGFLKILRDRTEARLSEEALSRSETRLRTLSETIPQLVWTSLAKGEWDWAGPQWKTYTGLSEPESVGQNWLRAVHPDDLASVRAAWQRATVAGPGDKLDVECRFMRHDGSWRWFQTRGVSVMASDSGQTLRWFGTSTDIDDLKRTEARANDSEARLARLLATAPAVIVEVDAAGVVTYANPAAKRMVGGELVGHDLRDPAWQPTTLEGNSLRPQDRLITRVLHAETVVDCKLLARMLDGTVRALSADAVAVRAPSALSRQGPVSGALIVFTDITEQHRAKSALERLNDTLEFEVAARTKERDRTWRLSQDLLSVCRADGTRLVVNPAWTATLGWTELELVDRHVSDLLHPDDSEVTLKDVDQLVTGVSSSRRTQNRYRHRDGSWRWFAWTSVAEDGLICATGRDITAERHASDILQMIEEQLRQAQKMEAIGQLTGGIAHDFNNLLQGIGASLEVLQRRLVRDQVEDVQRFIDTALKGVQRAGTLTQRLLAFARQQRLQPKSLELGSLVQGMEDLIRQTLGSAITLELCYHHDSCTVLADENQLESALLNLTINARDAMMEGGQLTITVELATLGPADVLNHEGAKPGDYVEVTIADTGIGMSPVVMQRAFDPFYTTKPLGQGTGLGLSQVYGFIRQSNGVVRLESMPQQGTTIRLFFPRYEASIPDESNNLKTAARVAQIETDHVGTILVVEDEQATREMIAEHLRSIGYRVAEASGGLQAIKALQSDPGIVLLVTDVGLPGLNGRQVAEAVRERRPGLSVLFITGFVGKTIVDDLPAGMALLRKPFRLSSLAEQVRLALTANNPAPDSG